MTLPSSLEGQRRTEISQHVADGDGLRRHPHPARRHHHRQPLHQGADHFKRQAARADDDGRPELDHRHAVRPQSLSHLVPAAQVRRQIRLILAQASEIDDALHARGARGGGEILRGQTVLRFKIARRAHRMNQIKRGFHTLHGRRQRCRVEQVALHHFDAGRHAGRQMFRLPRQTPHAPAIRHQQRQQPPADIAGRARQQDVAGLVHFRHGCFGWSSLRQLVFSSTCPDRRRGSRRSRVRRRTWMLKWTHQVHRALLESSQSDGARWPNSTPARVPAHPCSTTPATRTSGPTHPPAVAARTDPRAPAWSDSDPPRPGPSPRRRRLRAGKKYPSASSVSQASVKLACPCNSRR